MSLTDDDFQKAAALLGCDAASVQAVCQVETSGEGFLPDGRPKILFEAHTFHLLTKGQYDADHPNVSSPTWDRTLYGEPGEHQYDRLAEAEALDEDAALQSASWGRFQIMGENFRPCGFTSARDFVEAMKNSEADQLMAFAHFILANPHMRQALIDQDWSTFARLYNGPGYASNRYDIKLQQAYEALS